ncbi:18500_t:CDS:2, partial [Racocetra persica]
NNSLEEIEIKNCPHLRNIIVSHNQKREVGPTLEKLTITDCPEVRELYCSNNALTDLDISQLNQLTVLSYSDNKLSESKQAELAAKNLLESNPTGIPIKTFDDDFFIDNEEIIEIDISSELDELVIENCPNLKLLSFRHNRVGIIDLSGLPNLEN